MVTVQNIYFDLLVEISAFGVLKLKIVDFSNVCVRP